MKQWFNASGAAASGHSVAASITQAVQSGAAAVRQSVKNAEKKQHEQKEYLRLPVASARRLHWFEIRDLSALVRQHAQEKEQLMACVQAMRTCMLQRGITESAVDADVHMLLQHTDSIREADEGVSSALLVSLQDELERLRAMVHAKTSHTAFQAPSSPTFSTFSDHGAATHASEQHGVRVDLSVQDTGEFGAVRVTLATAETGAAAGGAGPRSDAARAAGALLRVAGQFNAACNQLVALQAALESALGAADRNGAAAAPSTSGRGSQAGSAELAGAGGNAPGVSGAAQDAPAPQGHTDAVSAARDILGQLARLEQRREHHLEEMSAVADRLHAAGDLVAASPHGPASPYNRPSHASALSRQSSASAAPPSAETSFAGAEPPVAMGAPARSFGGGGAARPADAGAGALLDRLEKQQKQLHALRQLVLREQDRAASAEKGRDALEAQCQRLREEVGGLQSELRRVKQHSDALQRAQDRAGAASPERGAGAASPSRDGAAAADLQAQAAALREKLAASRRGERHLERALAAAEAREAAAAAQAAALEGAVAGHDALAARLQVLQGRADDAAAERARATRYQEIAEQLEARVQALTEELISGAEVVSAIEARAAAAEAASLSAWEERRGAEGRSAAAARAVEAEVERRLREAGGDAAQWPQEARQAVQAAEAKARLAAAQAADAAAAARRWQERAAATDVEVAAAAAEGRLEAAGLRQQLRALEAEVTNLRGQKRRHGGDGALGLIQAQSGGGGGKAVAAAGGSLVEGGAADMAYLRGVLFSLLTAVATGATQQRDALLPVVGMLVGASPQQCRDLQQKLSAGGGSLLDLNIWPSSS